MRRLSTWINFSFMAPIALISVSDKTNIISLAKTLTEDLGFQIISSGGTAKLLASNKIPVTTVATYTGFPEILNGRVKTLHPKIHGGILASGDKESHINDLEKNNISKIDLVIVNLYPFKKTVAQKDVTWDRAIENIDIGGPTMVRAAAKNHTDVLVITNPNQYQEVIDALKAKSITNKFRKKLALDAFEHTASYDLAISKWMGKDIESTSSDWVESLPLKQNLRYGENPHQKASWYGQEGIGWGGAIKLQGKELSTNNLLDLESALATVLEFGYQEDLSNPIKQKAAVVVKHTNPCGVAIGDSPEIAIKKALDADRVSAFGGIVALNCTVNASTAEELKTLFVECIVAPYFTEDAKKILSQKKNLRILELQRIYINNAGKQHIRSILGGLLIQEKDNQLVDEKDWKVVTKLEPTESEYADLEFAWRLVRHIRSNAIAIASKGQSIGIGAGQMNRVGAAKIALEASSERASGAVLASDGFFPFEDTVRMAAKYGIKAIIQPGGSIRDQDSIIACNELGLKMVMTGRRHFLH